MSLGSPLFFAGSQNTAYEGQLASHAVTCGFAGGHVELGGQVQQAILQNDFAIGHDFTVVDGSINDVFVEPGQTLQLRGVCSMHINNTLYGGTLNLLFGCTLFYEVGSVFAMTSITVNGLNTAYSIAAGTIHNNIVITAAALAAAAGAAGFGGLAFVPGVAAITSGAQP